MKNKQLIIPVIIILISITSGMFIPKESIISTGLNVVNVACIALIIFLTNPYRIKHKRDV